MHLATLLQPLLTTCTLPHCVTAIVDYMHKQSGEAAKLLPTLTEVKGFQDKAEVRVVGFFDNLQDEKLRLYMDVGM